MPLGLEILEGLEVVTWLRVVTGLEMTEVAVGLGTVRGRRRGWAR